MHRIRKTKHPSVLQMERMAANLFEKYKEVVSVQPHPIVYSSGKVETMFWIVVYDTYVKQIETWEEVQSEYKKLMEGN